jgi:hypothetical protein
MGLNITTSTGNDKKVAVLQVQNNNDMTEAIINDGGSSGTPLWRNAMFMYNYYDDMTEISDYYQHTPILIDQDTVINDFEVLEKLKITPAQAKAFAEDVLNNAGIDYMKICAMYLVDDENTGKVDGIISPAKHYAYRLNFIRTVNDIPCSYINGMTTNNYSNEESIYTGNWTYETMVMLVNDEGIVSFNWYSPIEIMDTLVEKSALLTFDNIAEIFEQRIRDTYEPQAKLSNIVNIKLNVTFVSLELQRIAEQNSIESGLLVPVWNFYGTISTNNKDSENANQRGFDEPRPLLTINAVDGSIINLGMGY